MGGGGHKAEDACAPSLSRSIRRVRARARVWSRLTRPWTGNINRDQYIGRSEKIGAVDLPPPADFSKTYFATLPNNPFIPRIKIVRYRGARRLYPPPRWNQFRNGINAHGEEISKSFHLRLLIFERSWKKKKEIWFDENGRGERREREREIGGGEMRAIVVQSGGRVNNNVLRISKML